MMMQIQGLNTRLQYLVENHSGIMNKKQKAFLQRFIEQQQDDGQIQTIDEKQYKNIIQAVEEIMMHEKNTQDAVVEILRIFDSILEPVMRSLIGRGQQEQQEQQKLDYIFSIVLQYTSRFNYSILQYYAEISDSSPTIRIQTTNICIQKTLEILYRMMEAQPYLIKIWNCSTIFSASLDEIVPQISEKVYFLLATLRHLINPTSSTQQLFTSLKTLQNLDYLHSLTLIQQEEKLKQIYFNQLFDGQLVMKEIINENVDTQRKISKHEKKVMTKYLEDKIIDIKEQMEQNIFQHFVIQGEEGSGKMSFIELLSHSFHNKSPLENQEKDEHMDTIQQSQIIVVTLEETFDSKNLVGTYVCNESGEFVFKKGPLTVAAEQGLWLILRNIEKTPSDLLTFLLPLVQQNELKVSSAFTITPKLGFRIFALQKQYSSATVGSYSAEDIKPFLSHLRKVQLEKLDNREDFSEILKTLYPNVFRHQFQQLNDTLINSLNFITQKLNTQLKHQLLDHKGQSIRQLFKLYERIEKLLRFRFNINELQNEGIYLASDTKRLIIEEFVDIYMGYIYDKEIKAKLIFELVAQIWNSTEENTGGSSLDPQSVVDYINSHTREYRINSQSCFFGRSSPLQIIQKVEEDNDEEMIDQISHQIQDQKRKFVYTATTLRTMEQILQAITHNESALLVGETGTGKTTSVQQLATLLNKKLHVFNMNQNTDSADLLGGFKPVDLKFLLKPVYEDFLYIFKGLFKAGKNQQFLDLIQKCYEENRVKDFIQCLQHGMQSIKGSKNKKQQEREIRLLEAKIKDLQKRSKKLENGGGFIFQFIEGTLIQSIKNGDWILLDEINLASESVLNRISTLVDGDYILLNERADIVETRRHPDFRLFTCMNPPYTSAGKKQLPWSLRSKLTELYVPELDSQSDLWMIIDENCSKQLNENQKRKTLEFYIRVREQVFKQTKRGNIGLRNLSRALAFMKSAIDLKYPVIKAIYDSLYTCFASHLDTSLQQYIQSLILGLFGIKSLPELSISTESHLSDKYVYVEQFIIPKGSHEPKAFDLTDFVTTSSFKRLLKQLASIVAVTDYAVILQGPTSAGKTSTVQYLANITHNKVIRINNHMHTDIQEYLGSYVPDQEGQGNGSKLIFQEGVLVEAVRNGYWVILDELNLAPSEVLEALNRLLDDNRELLITETQKVVKAHPNFRIFATQNPTEGYGGRKELSEAFKNRFIMINVNEVPSDEMVEILVQKCGIPQSRADIMVKVMENLQIYRSQGNIFSGKESTITVRDLLKWAKRLRSNSSTLSLQDLALEGFSLLGERSRNDQDKQFIKQTIERVTGVKLNLQRDYEAYFQLHLSKAFASTATKLIPSQQLKRLAVLMHKCLSNEEPVLLVGETGCGKTSLCQVFAEIRQQVLYSINCHQNTETSDFIGCMRTRKNIKVTQDKFQTGIEEMEQQLKGVLKEDEIQQVQNIKNIKKKFELIKKYTKAQSLSNILKDKLSTLAILLQDLSCIFEWHDGILVDSMQTGGLLLIDEISLANDSVLERLNSVFEADRTLVLSEKSSREAIKIKAHNNFNMVATMNPSGDFGKKELSPALRNRMTEIWVESYFLQQELVSLYSPQNQVSVILGNENVSQKMENIDLYLIIEETVKNKIQQQLMQKKQDNSILLRNLSLALFNFIGFINFTLTQKFFSLQRKALSIRDILNMIDFVKVSLEKRLFKNQYQDNIAITEIEICNAFRHAVELVIIDGMCLGIDVAGDKQKRMIILECQKYLSEIERELFNKNDDVIEVGNNGLFVDEEDNIGVKPFILEKKQDISQQNKSYAFDAQTTKQNLLKVLRAYQLNKPILIEGPPGVGKTSLIENLAKVSGRKLIRVNLSEQTDMMDLLGSEYPMSAPNDSQNVDDDEDDIRFHWCDGVLLQALKEGHWFLIDEMNLAQQSVLEGLNALLDHRRTVYIPELNQEFVCHPDFFVFACQNPSQSNSSVGGRKTLPKSFLNRFNKIYLEELTQNDYKTIIERQIVSASNNEMVDTFQIDNSGILNVDLLLNLSHKLEKLIKLDNNLYQDEGAINIRDLSRFLNLFERFKTELRQIAGNSQISLPLFHAFDICYLQKIKKSRITEAIKLFKESGLIPTIEIKQDFRVEESVMVRIDDHNLGLKFLSDIKSTELSKDQQDGKEEILQLQMKDYLTLKGPQSKSLQYIIDCLNANLPLIIISNNPQKLLQNLQTLAKLAGETLNRLLLNEKSDTSQLLGCFEQTSQNDLQNFINKVLKLKDRFPQESLLSLDYTLKQLHTSQKAQLSTLKHFLLNHQDLLHELAHLTALLKKGTSHFEWVDSLLLQSVAQGSWVVFENANLCNPSILDRLNPLFETGNNSLSINEQGLVHDQLSNIDKLREVKAHDNFRAIFVISEKSIVDQGKDVSRALRNRCMQINVKYDEDEDSDIKRIFEKQQAIRVGESKIVDIRYSQMKWDLEVFERQYIGNLTVEERYTDLEYINDQMSGLGKRKERENQARNQFKPEFFCYNSEQLLKYMGSENIKKEHKYYLESYLSMLLKTFDDKILNASLGENYPQNEIAQFNLTNLTESKDSWQLFIALKIYLLRKQIQEQLQNAKNIFFNKQSQNFLTFTLSLPLQQEDLYKLLNYFLLLKQVRQNLKSNNLNNIQNYLNLYLMTQSTTNIINNTLSINEDPIEKVIMKYSNNGHEQHDLSQIIEKIRKSGKNPLFKEVINEIRKIQEALYDTNQQPIKICVIDLSNKHLLTNRINAQALVSTHSVLLMDEDKQILKFNNDQQKLDLYLLQEKLYSPYLILIPNDQSKILVSQSGDLYLALCYLKDLTKLSAINNSNQAKDLLTQTFKRYSKLPLPFYKFNNSSTTTTALQAYFIRLLTLTNLPSLYYQENNNKSTVNNISTFTSHFFESILECDYKVSLRDLPAYFLTNSTLQGQIDKVLLQNRNNLKNNNTSLREIILLDNNGVEESLKDKVREIFNQLDSNSPSEMLIHKQNLTFTHGNEKLDLALDNIITGLTVLQNINVLEILEALFIIPFELFRLENIKTLEQYHYYSKMQFLLYHLKSEAESQMKCNSILDSIQFLDQAIAQLSTLCPDTEAEAQLKPLLYFVQDLLNQLSDFSNILNDLHDASLYPQILDKIRVLNNMLLRGFDTFYLHFNHLLTVFFSAILTLITSLQTYISLKTLTQETLVLQNSLILFKQPTFKIYQTRLFTDTLIQILHKNFRKSIQNANLDEYNSQQLMYEQSMKYLIKFRRMTKTENYNNNDELSRRLSRNEDAMSTWILEYFIRREIGKKIRQEQQMDDMEALVYQLPFKMKMQNILEMNKPIDERTKEDKEKMEKEAKLEIETNFPSYFEEFQKTIFQGVPQNRDPTQRRQKTEIRAHSILNEILELDKSSTVFYKKSFIKLRLKILHQYFSNGFMNIQDDNLSYLLDAKNYLREDLNHHRLPSVMNVSEVKLAETYNFYHDSLPEETRLVYDPLMKLMIRIKNIINDWESPILNDALFLCNYIITECKPKLTPVMKMLTGMELILQKLEEWEIYAAKSINSCDPEMNLIKQLIIRYRKVQILSWRNLLSWKKNKMIKEDFDNFVRLAHTLERQVFDKSYYKKIISKGYGRYKEQEVEVKVFELLDLFIRDSSLGQFQARLKFIQIMLHHFIAKSKAAKYELLKFQYKNTTDEMKERLRKVINILHFVFNYYSQFQNKLTATINRLDANARDKVKTLIDVSKWTLQKFQQVKNNIDKTHRQLNKAVKEEEEILMQNISSLILTSSRKKYIKDDNQLEGLNAEKSVIQPSIAEDNFMVKKQFYIQSDNQMIKQLQYLEKKYLEVKWPDCQTLEYSISDIFERIKIVRNTNKKHIQRRAFIDLLKFMKEQGLQQNFSISQISQMLIHNQITQTQDKDYEKYCYKSYELMLLLDNSSQVDEKSDLRNVDIIRMKGFSQSLINKMLAINQSMEQMKNIQKQMIKLNEETSQHLIANENQNQGFKFSQDGQKKYQAIVKKTKIAYQNLCDKVKILDILDAQTIFGDMHKMSFNNINKTILTEESLVNLETQLNSLIKSLETKSQVITLQRHSSILEEALISFHALNQDLSQLFTGSTSHSNSISTNPLSKRVKLLQKYIQLFFQDTLKLLEQLHQAQRKDSITADTILSQDDQQPVTHHLPSLELHQKSSQDPSNQPQPSLQDDDDCRLDLTIKEHQEFITALQPIIITNLEQIIDVSQKIFQMKDVVYSENDQESRESVQEEIRYAAQMVKKVVGVLEFVRENEENYIKSMAKFSYISQRIFIYLIYEGFCGQDDQDQEQKDQEDQENDKYFEQEGCGMGDGQGGENNVSNQIEHEEQLEGLKNYESDEEKKQEQKEDKKDEEKEEDNNDFEMKEADFDGELEDVPDKEEKEEDKKDEESDEDDALDKVDDLLDNQLWNQNMEDLEKQQEEDEKDDKKKEQEEIDLGERELDQENQLKEQDKDVKAGDRDKQDREDQKKENDDQQEQQKDQEMADEHESQNDEMPPDDQEGQEQEEIPLDRESNIGEDEGDKDSQKAKDDEDMEDIKSQDDDEANNEEDAEKKQKEEEDKIEEFEDQQEDQEIQQEDDQMEQDINEQQEDGQEEYKKDFNKQVLENDQIQTFDQDKQKQLENEQSNLKNKQKESQNTNQQQSKNKQNQSSAQDLDQQTQFDVEGSDILYQLANKIQQQQQQKQNQSKPQPQPQPEPLDLDKKTLDNPQMRPDSQPQLEQDQHQQLDQRDNEAQHAMEYEFDDQAEQLQGKLATDKVEEQQQKLKIANEEQNDDIIQNAEEDVDMNEDEGDIQQTQQQILNKSMKQAIEQESQIMDDITKENREQFVGQDLQEEIKEEELIDKYQKYLLDKVNNEVDLEEVKEENNNILSTFQYDLDRFDYAQQKLIMRELFNLWAQNPALHEQSLQLLNNFKQQTTNSSSSLCEQLRIVLEPQLSQQLQGDYKTGKRLNMKKVISFIASHYRNDKIWLRRTMPSKRDYKILIAIDDSLSMKENNLGFFSLEALVTIMEALNRLEVGKVAVAGIRERLDLFQAFEDGYSNERTAFIVSQFNFNYSAPKSADYAMANFVRDTNQLLDSQNTGMDGIMNCPFVIVLSDGRFNKNNVRPYLNEAKEKKYLYIFVILDSVNTIDEKKNTSNSSSSGKAKAKTQGDGSILSMKSAEKNEETGAIKLVPYLRDFPFEYYCIVRDIHQLPSALGSILVQWFSLMSGSNGK